MTDKFFSSEQGGMDAAKEAQPKTAGKPKSLYPSAPRARDIVTEVAGNIRGTNPGAK